MSTPGPGGNKLTSHADSVAHVRPMRLIWAPEARGRRDHRPADTRLWGGEAGERPHVAAARLMAKAFRERVVLPHSPPPSSYLVNKDILLGVIPAEQEGLLGGTLVRPPQLPKPKSCPSLLTGLPWLLAGGGGGRLETGPRQRQEPEVGIKRSIAKTSVKALSFLRAEGRRQSHLEDAGPALYLLRTHLSAPGAP